jgi:hypothetical protein
MAAGREPGVLSPDEQWERVSKWHAFCDSDSVTSYPFVHGLVADFDQIDGGLERGADLRTVAATPLQAFFYFVEMGIYPPPELLLTLADCWTRYRGGAGALSLEDAFLGPAKKAVGNQAARDARKFKKLHLQWNFASLLGRGMTRAQAAEALSLLPGMNLDADSILRMCRGISASKSPPIGLAEK